MWFLIRLFSLVILLAFAIPAFAGDCPYAGDYSAGGGWTLHIWKCGKATSSTDTRWKVLAGLTDPFGGVHSRAFYGTGSIPTKTQVENKVATWKAQLIYDYNNPPPPPRNTWQDAIDWLVTEGYLQDGEDIEEIICP